MTNNEYLNNENTRKSDLFINAIKKYDSTENKNFFNIESPQKKKNSKIVITLFSKVLIVFKLVMNRYYTFLYCYIFVFYNFLFSLFIFFVPVGQFNSKCQCNSFFTLNKDANKIFNSKTQHFAFNYNALEARTKFLRQKEWEAKKLKNLIVEDKKNIQSKIDLPTLSFINKRKEYCMDSEEIGDNHIDPTILKVLKDVYVDVEYLSDSCDYYDGNI